MPQFSSCCRNTNSSHAVDEADSYVEYHRPTTLNPLCHEQSQQNKSFMYTHANNDKKFDGLQSSLWSWFIASL